MQPTDGTGPSACVLSLITAADRSAKPVYAAGTTQVEQRDAGAIPLRRRNRLALSDGHINWNQ
ncbi:hypothetical protein DMX78_01510 [Cutibacterium acnes]|jgi:hypothetical protein|uniref:Uncharacterized protein n=1 Tax=Cutibacterium acnes TaxID=1747 RepID=A0A2B7ICP6_CUTAC|nr:hypothetical protein CPA42_01550 [Cutibacterium acnes]EFT21164.1 hypothetical protein HMPREF9566_00799 [Cutibacterium acnes HL045PA1]EGE93925.1 hypothetical protein HMPREF9570_01553 [Cutibacterium acnes HL043PA1]EGF03760.1 hypothetical protein HMPREF9584_00300 [Cutibacterium acnes HL092PA1]OQY13481.1 MAG: hypothetical protein B6I33_04890 [Propionibacterium sp. 4572_24]PGF26856.1 hypothetical protein B1B06_05990 [Cutibacterium acnes subsp. acnes]QAZ47919.1 hypothetical protein cact_01555 [C